MVETSLKMNIDSQINTKIEKAIQRIVWCSEEIQCENRTNSENLWSFCSGE